MADTAAALVIQLSADFKDFEKQIKKSTGIFDAEGRKIEKRQADLKKRLSNWSLDFTGLSGLNKALVGLTAAGAVTGLFALTKAGLDAASAIGDVSTQAGVSVEFLQKMRFAASQSGATFDIMDTALTTLNKTFGDFVNTGAGKGAQSFKTLGLDKLINAGEIRNTEQLFDALIKRMSSFGSEAQKAAFLASFFGKEAGPKLLQLVNQGAAGIAALEAQAVSLGIVLSTQTVKGAKDANDKLDALFNVMKAQGVAAVAALAPQIAHLAQQITEGLPSLITWVEKWAAWFGLIDLSPVQQAQIKIKELTGTLNELTTKRNAKDGLDGFLNNLLGGNNPALDSRIAKLKSQIAEIQGQLAAAQAAEAKAPKAPVTPPPALHVNDIAGQAKAEAEKKAAEALALRRQQFLAQTVIDQKTAAAALLAAQNESNVELLRGSAEYYNARKQQIDDEFTSEVDVIFARAEKQKAELARQGTDWAGYADAVRNIESTLTDDLATEQEKRQQKLHDAGPAKLIQDALIQSKEQIKAYQDETAALGLTAGALAKFQYIHEQLNIARERGLILTQEQIAALEREGVAVGHAADQFDLARKATERDIEASDAFRQGLIDVGLAGVHGLDSLKDAGLRFLETIGEMILQLYVLKPLVESIGGSFGTPFGGAGGFMSIFGFTDGGIGTPNGPRALKRMAGGGVRRTASIFAEKGPEAAVPLPDGRSIPVDLRMPTANGAGAGGGVQVQQFFDLTGAVVTQELYDRMTDIAARQAQGAVAKFNSDVMPSRVRTLVRDPRRNY